MTTLVSPVAHLLARRQRTAAALQSRAAQSLGEAATPPIVLLGAGEMIPVPGQHDRVYPFMAHSAYFYLTEQQCPGGVMAIDLADDGAEPWHAFAPEVTQAHRTWEGDVAWEGVPLAELTTWLARRRGRAVAAIGCPVAGFAGGVDRGLSAELEDAFLHARRVLDDVEIEHMRQACAATAAGHAYAHRMLTSGEAAGMTERQLQVEIEAEFFRNGGDGTPYDTIVGSGPHAAVLHFAPGDRVIAKGECVLIDAGAAVQRYASDVTRTWSVGEPSQTQRDVINIVIDSEEAGIAMCKPGVEWHDVHRRCSEVVLEGLVGLGALTGDPVELVERGVAGLFFPHGVGHMIGLGVRGAGGRLPGRAPRKGPGGVGVRVDIPLEAGHGFTVEPGLYFIPGLIDVAETRESFADVVKWDSIDTIRQEIQGVRIEDDIVIREHGCEVLTEGIVKRLD
ncbi:MAG: M24 family metallopeptidase [Phycisphaerales bacterium]|nr:M24 family metallopeptidase [Phycisphaerales bacterium]